MYRVRIAGMIRSLSDRAPSHVNVGHNRRDRDGSVRPAPRCSGRGGLCDWVPALGEAGIVREMTPVGWNPTDLLVKFFSMANPDYGSWNCEDSDPAHVMEWLAGRDREAREAFASGAPFQADLPLHGDKVAGVLQMRGREMTLMKYETVTEPAKTVGKRHYKPREKRVLVSVGPVDGTYDAVWGFWPTLQHALEMLPLPDKVEKDEGEK